jgi:hypothetical protein
LNMPWATPVQGCCPRFGRGGMGNCRGGEGGFSANVIAAICYWMAT